MVEHLEPEQLAALLDGRLPSAEREAVLQRLAASPALYSEFLETQALLAVLNQSEPMGDAPTDAPRLHTMVEIEQRALSNKRGRFLLFAAPMLVAAALAVVLLRPDATRASGVESVFAGMLPGWTPGSGAVQQRLGAEWNLPTWSVLRGADDALSRENRAFRMGARIAELEVAGLAADTAAAQEAMLALERLLESVDLGAPLAAEAARVRASETLHNAAARRTLYARIREVTGVSHAVDLGIWLEAARLAAIGDDAAFFLTTAPAYSVWVELRESVVFANSMSSWSGVIRAVDALYAAEGEPGIERARSSVAQAFSALPR